MKNAYQIQITLNLAVCFFNTVCVLFITISEYRANTDWTLWISGLLWVAYYVLRVIMICASAAAVIDQVTYITHYFIIIIRNYKSNFENFPFLTFFFFFEIHLTVTSKSNVKFARENRLST